MKAVTMVVMTALLMVGKLVEMSVESLVVMKGTRMVDLMAASLVVAMVDQSVKPTAV